MTSQESIGLRMIDTKITHIHARRVWDSRGRPTVEAEVRLACGARGRAIAPAGASRGSREAVDLRDGGAHLGGYDVQRAVANVNGEIARRLRGMHANDHAAIDAALCELDGTANKSRLGGNAMIAVSMACAWAAANAAGVPLWNYLRSGDDGVGLKSAGGAAREVVIPLPEIQIFGGGAHAGRRVDIQDFMLVAPGAASFAHALEWTAEVYLHAGKLMAQRGLLAGVADEGGYWPLFTTNEEALDMLMRAIDAAGLRFPDQVAISLDVAASEFYRGGYYELGLEKRRLSSEEFGELLLGWLRRYPIVSIEDPLAEDDEAGLQRFTRAVAASARGGQARVQIVGDDYLVTNAARVRHAASIGACNAVLVKPNQAGTLSETLAAWRAAQEVGFGAIVSARSGETEDVTIVHLAIGWGVRQLKVGSFARSERMAKWNEVLRIEESLGARARFAGAIS
jgi:enolase